jgi:hypothetical protein
MSTISFDDFINKHLGNKLDFDGWYGGQCTDLYRFYVKEVLGFPQSPGVGGATEIWDTADPKYYDFIENTPNAIPKQGDIVIWDRRVGSGFGHVAIFLEGDVNSFVSLDQNFPTLNKVTKTKHDYKAVKGWLRPKVQITQEPMEKELKELLDYYKVKDIPELKRMVDEQLTFLESARKGNKELKDKYDSFILWVVNELKPSGMLPPITDENLAKQLIEELIRSEDQLRKELTQGEKKWALEKSELVEEKKHLQKRVNEMEEELVVLQKKIQKFQDDMKDYEEKEKEVSYFEDFINKLKSI